MQKGVQNIEEKGCLQKRSGSEIWGFQLIASTGSCCKKRSLYIPIEILFILFQMTMNLNMQRNMFVLKKKRLTWQQLQPLIACLKVLVKSLIRFRKILVSFTKMIGLESCKGIFDGMLCIVLSSCGLRLLSCWKMLWQSRVHNLNLIRLFLLPWIYLFVYFKSGRL